MIASKTTSRITTMHGDRCSEVFLAAAVRGEGLNARAACAFVCWEAGECVAEFSARIPSRFRLSRVPLNRTIAEVAALYAFVDTQEIAQKDLLIRTESRFLLEVLQARRRARFDVVDDVRITELNGMFWMISRKLNLVSRNRGLEVKVRRRMSKQATFEGRPKSVLVRPVAMTRNRHGARLALAALAQPEDQDFFRGATTEVDFDVVRSKRS